MRQRKRERREQRRASLRLKHAEKETVLLLIAAYVRELELRGVTVNPSDVPDGMVAVDAQRIFETTRIKLFLDFCKSRNIQIPDDLMSRVNRQLAIEPVQDPS